MNTLSLRRGVPVTRKAVKAALEVSLRRMGVERLDLVQLCWWVIGNEQVDETSW